MTYPNSQTYDCIIHDGGTALDASVKVFAAGPLFGLVLESRSGSKTGPRSRNPDYLPALDLILERLRNASAQIVSIEVVSRIAMSMPEPNRILPMKFPIVLSPLTNTSALRINITEMQRQTARTSRAADSSGGNNTKRIQIMISLSKGKVANVFEFTQLISGN